MMREEEHNDLNAFFFGHALRAIETFVRADAEDQGTEALGISGLVAQMRGGHAQHAVAQIMALCHRARVTLLHNQPALGRKLDRKISKELAAVDPEWIAKLGDRLPPTVLVMIHLGYSAGS